MSDIITGIWYGNVAPIEHFGEHSKKMRQLELRLQRQSEQLQSLLNESECKILEHYNETVSEYQMLTVEQAFGDGFALGIMLVAEAGSRAEQLL